MRNSADAIIIGGGMIGMSVAFYLSRANFGQVVLLEKEALPGMGATSKAAGGIRAQFTTRENIEMSMLSEKIFARFKEETGIEALFDQIGYMFLLEDETDINEFTKAYDLQKTLGLNVQMLNPDEINRLAPHVNLDGIKSATFCLDDGLIDPHEFLIGYEKAARRNGVEIIYQAEVTAIDTDRGKVTGLKTSQGNISTSLIIDCAGPYSKLIGQMAGVIVPVEPVRRQIVTTGELDFVKPGFPMVVDVKSGLYCHKESKGMLLGWADKSVQPSFDISVDPDYTDSILERALNRIPQLETAKIANQWAGLYETTPDHRAIIGYAQGLDGLFHVTGFSGHGLMHAPAAGVITAEVLTGQKPSVDIAPLSIERFARGVEVVETNVI